MHDHRYQYTVPQYERLVARIAFKDAALEKVRDQVDALSFATAHNVDHIFAVIDQALKESRHAG